MCVTETHSPHTQIALEDANLDGISFYGRSRHDINPRGWSGNAARGVGFFVKNGRLTAKKHDDAGLLPDGSFAIELRAPGIARPKLDIATYVAHGLSTDERLALVEATLQYAETKSPEYEVRIMGDFNVQIGELQTDDPYDELTRRRGDNTISPYGRSFLTTLADHEFIILNGRLPGQGTFTRVPPAGREGDRPHVLDLFICPKRDYSLNRRCEIFDGSHNGIQGNRTPLGPEASPLSKWDVSDHVAMELSTSMALTESEPTHAGNAGKQTKPTKLVYNLERLKEKSGGIAFQAALEAKCNAFADETEEYRRRLLNPDQTKTEPAAAELQEAADERTATLGAIIHEGLLGATGLKTRDADTHPDIDSSRTQRVEDMQAEVQAARAALHTALANNRGTQDTRQAAKRAKDALKEKTRTLTDERRRIRTEAHTSTATELIEGRHTNFWEKIKKNITRRAQPDTTSIYEDDTHTTLCPTIEAAQKRFAQVWAEKAVVNLDDPKFDKGAAQDQIRKLNAIKAQYQQINWRERLRCNPENSGKSDALYSVKEVESAIKRLKSGTSHSPIDQLPVAAFKAGGPALAKALQALFNLLLTIEKSATEWATVPAWPLHKKGPTEDPNMYRLLCIVSVLCKLKELCMHPRISRDVDAAREKSQYGSTKATGTDEAIFVAHTIVRDRARQNQPTVVCVVDKAKAFASTFKEGLLVAAHEAGLRGKLWRQAVAMYETHRIQIMTANGMCEPYECPGGIKEGSVLSPDFFKIKINRFSAWLRENHPHLGVSVRGVTRPLWLQVLLYVDDENLFTDGRDGSMQRMLDAMFAFDHAERWTSHPGKTVIIEIDIPRHLRRAYYLGPRTEENRIKVVDQAPILGTLLHYLLSPAPHIEKVSRSVAIRCAKLRAQGATHGLMPFSVSVFLFKMHVNGIICSDIATWGWGDIGRLEQLIHMYLATAAGVKMTNATQYTRLRAEAKQKSAADMFHGAVLQRARRMTQHDDDSIEHQLFAAKSATPRKNAHKLLQHRTADAAKYFTIDEEEASGSEGLTTMSKGMAKKTVKAWAAATLSRRLTEETASSSLGSLFKMLWNDEDPPDHAAIHDSNDPETAIINSIRINGGGLNRYNKYLGPDPENRLCPCCDARRDETVEHMLTCTAYQDLRSEFVSNQDAEFDALWAAASEPEKLRIMCCLETADDPRDRHKRWYTMIGAANFFQQALTRRDVMIAICGRTYTEATQFRAQHGEQLTNVKEIISGRIAPL